MDAHNYYRRHHCRCVAESYDQCVAAGCFLFKKTRLKQMLADVTVSEEVAKGGLYKL